MKISQNTAQSRRILPLFNALICALMGALVGYYVGAPLQITLLAVLAGLAAGLLCEYGLGRLGSANFFYRRRALLLALVEMPFFVFVIGPFAYVWAGTRPVPAAVTGVTPLDYGASSYEQVSIKAGTDVSLAGWYVPPRSTPGPVVIVLHGAYADRRGALEHARPLLADGYGVLLYDQRALGESSGKSLSFGWYDGADLLAAVDWLKSRPEVDPQGIGALGLSLGAHIALNAAYQKPLAVSSLWLDGMQAQRIEDYPQAENTGERFATFINRLILKMAEIRLGQPAPPAFTSIIRELDQPRMVLVAGAQDDFERRVNQRYADIAGSKAQVWIIPDAGHVGGLAAHPVEYTRRMLAFFQATLIR